MIDWWLPINNTYTNYVMKSTLNRLWGGVTAVQGHGGVVTEDMVEAMHRTESVQVATRRRRAGATGSKQNFKNNLLPD